MKRADVDAVGRKIAQAAKLLALAEAAQEMAKTFADQATQLSQEAAADAAALMAIDKAQS